MFLSAGVLEVDDGELRLGDLEPTGDLQLEGEGVQVPGDQGALWGWARPGREWRNLAMSPQFPATAELAARMWTTRGGPPLDGVISLDVRALAALLAATGPVDVDGRQIGREDVEPLLLHDQYEGLTYDRGGQGLQDQRRDRLGEIARAVVDKLQAGDADLPVLAEGIGDAAAGRHLLLWASAPGEQEAWGAAGVAGEVGPDALLLAVLNRGGNKLDPFLDVDAEIRSDARADGEVRVEVHVRLANLTPEGEPVYVAGPRPDHPEIGAGDYVGLVSLTMPAAATELALGDGRLRQVTGRDGSSQVVATNVQLARGTEDRLVFSFLLPAAETRTVTVAASARVPATEWTAAGQQWSDDSPRTVHLRP